MKKRYLAVLQLIILTTCLILTVYTLSHYFKCVHNALDLAITYVISHYNQEEAKDIIGPDVTSAIRTVVSKKKIDNIEYYIVIFEDRTREYRVNLTTREVTEYIDCPYPLDGPGPNGEPTV